MSRVLGRLARWLGLLVLGMLLPGLPAAPALPASVRFAVIGDYGSGTRAELDVSALVTSWNPDLIITTGDNNYPNGSASKIDAHIGQYYHGFIRPYTGRYGAGAGTNRFFPSLGNHDWLTAGARPYLDYFTLPNNERYYDFTWGPVHFFAVDSDPHEPDGNRIGSLQADWLHRTMAASTAPWKLVYFHHPPYSSGRHGSSAWMQWPFQAWGAAAVLSGHDHDYERLLVNGFPYFVDGLGGQSIRPFGRPVSGSQVRYNADYGAMLVTADAGSITFQFVNRKRLLVDSYTLHTSSAASGDLTGMPISRLFFTPQGLVQELYASVDGAEVRQR